jgi:hypothetical protein
MCNQVNSVDARWLYLTSVSRSARFDAPSPRVERGKAE